MGIEYHLDIATALEPSQALRVMGSELGIELNGHGNLAPPGLFISASKKGERGQALFEEMYGFRPTVHVGFRVQTQEEEDTHRAKRVIARLLVELLQHEQGDAVFMHGIDNPVLQRLSGKVVFNEGWDDYTELMLDAAGILYERRKLELPSL
jgi:hypothetical protein